MQININKLTLAKVCELSPFIKEKCKGTLTLEETAQELMKTLYQTFISDNGESAIVLTRFFKSCSYCDLPGDIQDDIKQKEGRTIIPPQDKYLTLLGTWGDLEEWRQREKSENYKAFSLNDSQVLYKFPMLSAVFSQIGFKIPTAREPDKSIIVDKQDVDYGLFYVEDTKDNKLVPKQAEFVVPFGVKSAIGFGGHYVSTDVYATIIFFRENVSLRIAKLFLSLDPAIKLLTLGHDITKNSFQIDSSESKPSEVLPGLENILNSQKVECLLKSEEAKAIADELMKTNEALKEEIKEHKSARDSIQESEMRFRSLLSSLYEAAIVVYNRDGNITALWGTKEMDKRYGLRAVDTIGKSIRELLPPAQAEQRLSELRHVFATGEKTVVEYVNSFPGGNFWHETSLSPMRDTEGNIKAVVGFVRDITERKKMEEELLHSEKLKSLGTITAGIAHEFNNILTVISGHVQLMEKKYKSFEALSNTLLTVKGAADDGAKITKRMLQFTKTAEDTSGFNPVNINEEIKYAIDFTMPRWRNMSQTKAINYRIEEDGIKEVPEVLCSYVELRGVFVNIINNALDAMPEGGTVSFRTWNNDETVFVSVSDTGSGMSREVMKKVFDPFFTTRSPKGTGLGMSIVYGIMIRHGGKIEVDSEIGKGSTFTLQLPFTIKTASPVTSLKPEQNIRNKSLSILVVDDEKNTCALLDDFLSDEGHKIKSVFNGADAIRLLKSEEYDLVLSDLVMPD
ncbi:MAG: PAS domain S-box protein, partial [Candidatus Scalindua sp.]|nr:PAS domain S-box protein [Candidatus Scalindua sp.]